MELLDREFRTYFERINRPKMTYKDAQTLIDYVSGPVPEPHEEAGAMDMSKVRVSGGGRIRPSKEKVDSLIERLEDNAETELETEWDRVFLELIERCKCEPRAPEVIEYAYRLQLPEDDILKMMNISRATYFNYKSTILSQAGILAVKYEIISY
jgi:hypothetical protein